MDWDTEEAEEETLQTHSPNLQMSTEKEKKNLHYLTSKETVLIVKVQEKKNIMIR